MRKKRGNDRSEILLENLSRIDNNIDALDRSMSESLNGLIGLAKTMRNAYLDNKQRVGEARELIAQIKAKN